MTAILFLQSPISYSRYATRYLAVEGDTDPVAYEWLRLGVRAAMEGNREDARYYFVQAVRTDLNFARAWLYLGGVADDPALTLSCMQKVLQVQPNEPQAWKGLIWAREKLGLLQLPLPLMPTVPTARRDLAPAPAPPVAAAPAMLPPAPVAAAPPAAPPAGTIRRLTPLPTTAPLDSGAPALPAPAVPPAADEAASGTAILREIARQLMRRGTAAAAAGNRGRARYYFLKAIAADSSNARAWLYLGGVADDPSMTLACMERVLRSEPDNPQAQVGAEWARGRLGLPTVPLGWWE